MNKPSVAEIGQSKDEDRLRSKALRLVGIGLLSCALLAGCVSAPGDAPKSSKPAGTTKGGQPNDPPAGSEPPAPPAVTFAKVDSKLGAKAVYSLAATNVKVSSLSVTKAPGMAMALEIIRTKALRDRAQVGGGNIELTEQVIASSSKVLGVNVIAKNSTGVHNTTVWYDAASNRFFASPALIQPSMWTKFLDAVAQQAGENGPQIKAQLQKQNWPQGSGASIGFSAEGDIVVQPEPVGGKALDAISIKGDDAASWLTQLGVIARAGARFPTAFAAPEAYKPMAASLIGDATGAAASDPRPSMVIGTDCSKVKCVAVTFDDGPVPQTAEVLETLKKYKVPATFFQLGTSVDNFPEMVTEVAAAGMPIASHNQVHNPMTKYSSETLDEQLGKSVSRIVKYSGADPLFMRPPYGDRNKRVDAVIRKHNMAVAIWDVDTNDWQVSGKSQQAAQEFILRNLGKYESNGSVVLLHDIHANSRASTAAVIEKLQADGFTLVTLSELNGNWMYEWGKKFCSAPAKETPCQS